jgi:MFS family permease
MFGISSLMNEWIPPGDLRRLVLSRGLRSLTQGYILVIFTIYLSQIGFSAWLIGLTLGIGSAVSAILTLLTGILSDRIGRMPFLLAYSALLAASGIVFGITTVPYILIAVSALGGIGRSGGAGGQAGPFTPAETALLSEKTTIENRTKVFTINTILGTIATAIGAVFAGAPQLLNYLWTIPIDTSYRIVYFGIAAIGVATFFIILPVKESIRIKKNADVLGARARRKTSISRIWKFSVAGLLNGFGLGFVTGILSYWLYIRFHVSPESIGLVMAAGMILTSLVSLWIVKLAERFGDIAVITASRAAGVVFTVLLAISPIYPLAALFVILRAASAMSAMPIRQSYTMGIVESDLRGTASGVSGVARRIPAAFSPAIAGYWITMGEFELPFFASALFMGANAILYFLWFRNIKPSDFEKEGMPIVH